MNVAFFGSGRCFHTFDWFRSCSDLLGKPVPFITDNYEGDGLPCLFREGDDARELIIIDRLLSTEATAVGHKWRNLIKFLVIPIQIFLLRRHLAKLNQPFLLAHSTYYAFVASFTRAPYAAIPQGSEVLVRPKSRFYRWLLQRSVRKARFITVDSEAMRKVLVGMTDRPVFIVQNGINIRAVQEPKSDVRDRIMSIRAISSNYRIAEIFAGRDAALPDASLTLTFPFTEGVYYEAVSTLVQERDAMLGCIDKTDLYGLMASAICVVSIPESDSSPRSVYEAIFAGAAALCAPAQYIEALPECMRARVIVVDVTQADWLGKGVALAKEIVKNPYIPSEAALVAFDQRKSMARCLQLIEEVQP
ncbi:glycosyltransferase [Sphingomonas soli]|uniref:glycosyltransferase n=1 Tax=Sphingomonas soli TaxID=266127 RepID=UPI000834E183|nr:glycosyltransferase [Sphingomonas soli]